MTEQEKVNAEELIDEYIKARQLMYEAGNRMMKVLHPLVQGGDEDVLALERIKEVELNATCDMIAVKAHTHHCQKHTRDFLLHVFENFDQYIQGFHLSVMLQEAVRERLEHVQLEADVFPEFVDANLRTIDGGEQ